MLCLDNYIEISRWIDEGSTWKSWLFTCKVFASMNTREKKLEFAHGLSSLVRLLPNKDWVYDRVANSAKLEIIQENAHRISNWFGASMNPFVTLDIVKRNPCLPWCPNGFSCNPNVTAKLVSENMDLPVWCFAHLSDSLPIEQIKEYDYLPWRIQHLFNTTITVEFLRENREFVSRFCRPENLHLLENRLIASWRWRDKRPFTFDQYRLYPNLEWDWKKLAPIADFTCQEILSIPDREFSSYFSVNRAITIEVVKSHPGKGWDYWLLSQNPNVTIETIKEHPDVNWVIPAFSRNRNVTTKVVKENPDFNWNSIGLSVNPSITWLDIYENPHIKWDFYVLSCRK